MPTAPVDADFFLDLRFSKLRHNNTVFPLQKGVYTLTYRIYTSLAPFRINNYPLREVFDSLRYVTLCAKPLSYRWSKSGPSTL